MDPNDQFDESKMVFFPKDTNKWSGKKAQEAYLAGGAITFVIMCLISIVACMIYACIRYWRSSEEEKRIARKKRREQSNFKGEEDVDSPIQQRGRKYMPQIDVSQDELNHEFTSSTQTFFFPPQK